MGQLAQIAHQWANGTEMSQFVCVINDQGLEHNQANVTVRPCHFLALFTLTTCSSKMSTQIG